MSEPGLDLHEWESQWASVAEEQDGDAAAALSQYADIVERVLVARGYNVADPVETAGDEPEIVTTYVSAREVAERAEVGDASRADIGDAIEDLRALFEMVTAARP
jgi:basic membrane lipoprotein Med (substrate-binding protein (PBP1-ABC) superfamily)